MRAIRYVVLYWVDFANSDGGTWKVYHWDSNKKLATKAFHQCKEEHNNAGLVEINTLKRWNFPFGFENQELP